MITILIAEDNDDLRTLLRCLFTRAGFRVLDAADGRAALELGRRQPPDVVLTDLDMPHLDGVGLCQAIRADPALADTPVAILTGGLQPGDPRTQDAQICGVLLKPFTNDDWSSPCVTSPTLARTTITPIRRRAPLSPTRRRMCS
jgi:CheY-like chemotaxis protein